MNVKYLFYSLLAVIALSIGVVFVSLFAFPDPTFRLEKGDRVTVLPDETLEQPFVSSRDGLRQIEVLFGNFNLQGDTRLLLELKDNACVTVLARKMLSHGSFDSEHTSSFTFDRIPDSGGKMYCFTARVSGTMPLKKDKAPRFFIDKASPAAPYSLIAPNGVQDRGTGAIAIRPGYANSTLSENVEELTDRISQYKPPFLKSWFLITFSFIGFILTLGTILLLIREEDQK
ncbi:hypothetical protein MASR2M41_18570 [Flammeovirgaceae bacterium]